MTINKHLAICQSRPYEISDDIWVAHLHRVKDAGLTMDDLVAKCGDTPDLIPAELFQEDPKEGAIAASIARVDIVTALSIPENLEEHMFVMHSPAAQNGLCEWTPIGAYSIRNHSDSIDDHINSLCKRLGLSYNPLRTDFSLKMDEVHDYNGFSYYKISDDRGHHGEFIQLWAGIYAEMTKDEFIKAMKRDLNIDYSGLSSDEMVKRFEAYLYKKDGIDIKTLEEKRALGWESIREEVESEMNSDEEIAIEGEI